jgi:hypothetical protein
MAMCLPSVTSAVFLIANVDEMWVSQNLDLTAGVVVRGFAYESRGHGFKSQ